MPPKCFCSKSVSHGVLPADKQQHAASAGEHAYGQRDDEGYTPSGCIQASRLGSSFLHPDFCGTGALKFGAGLTTLDGTHANLFIPCLLASPPNLQQQCGGLQSSLKIGIKCCQPRVVKKWGFWGAADRTSSTQARLPGPGFLDQPQLYFQKWGCFQVSLEMCI